MATTHESSRSEAETRVENAAEGALTQILGEFIAGDMHPRTLLLHLTAMQIIPPTADPDFLQLVRTFESGNPGITAVTFTPETHHQRITTAVENLISLESFTAKATADDENKIYSYSVYGAKNSALSSMQQLTTRVRYPSDITAEMSHHIHQLPTTPSESPFVARSTHDNFLKANPFIGITIDHGTLASITIGYGHPPGDTTRIRPPIPLSRKRGQ